MKPALSTLILTLLVAAPLAAQEEEDPRRWSAEAGLALAASGGNEDLTVFSTNLGLTRLETDAYELALKTRFRYGRNNGETVAENLHGEMNLDLWPEASWSPFLFATGEKDPIKQLEGRLNGGAGLKRTFWQQDWNEVSLSGAMLYSFENLEVPDSLGDGISRTARWSFRTVARTVLGAGSKIEQTVFFHPAYDRLEDYQLESVTDLRVALSERLAFTTVLLYQRDNTPAPDVKADDYAITVGLSLSTQW